MARNPMYFLRMPPQFWDWFATQTMIDGRDKQVIEYRRTHAYEETAKHFKITALRLRNIECRALTLHIHRVHNGREGIHG